MIHHSGIEDDCDVRLQPLEEQGAADGALGERTSDQTGSLPDAVRGFTGRDAGCAPAGAQQIIGTAQNGGPVRTNAALGVDRAQELRGAGVGRMVGKAQRGLLGLGRRIACPARTQGLNSLHHRGCANVGHDGACELNYVL